MEQLHRAAQVVAVILERLGHAFAHGLEAGEMDDRIDRKALEDTAHGLRVEQRRTDEMEARRCAGRRRARTLIGDDDIPDAVDRDFARIREIVHHDDFEARIQKLDAGMAADESGAAGHEDGLHDASAFPISYVRSSISRAADKPALMHATSHNALFERG